MTSARRSQRAIFAFWLPLAATWLMMAAEGPYLTAVVARLPEPTFNLAAFGVTLAFAFMIEAPVVMLMTASTALARDEHSFRRLRGFAYGLCVLVTVVQVVVLLPPVFELLAITAMSVPEPVARLTYGSLLILLPWPAAIGYRRFYQGLLIRDGRTRLVAVGTVIRLACMSGAAFGLFALTSLPGAYVAAAGLTAGVVGEALASRVMAHPSIGRVMARPRSPALHDLTLGRMVDFYTPLALTSLLGFAVHPLLTFFMGRAPQPIVSLAVFPVVNALGFVFRAAGLAFQEVAIALMGEDFEHVGELRLFALVLGTCTSLGLALVALTPLSHVWFVRVSGLTPELAAYAIVPVVVMIPVPFLSVMLSMLRGVLVSAQDTRPITVATAVEVSTIAVVFPLLAYVGGVLGVTAAAAAFTLGRCGSVSTLLWRAVGHVRAANAPA